MKKLLLVLALNGCGHGCPPKTTNVADECKMAILRGEKTKAQCEKEIESACP